MSEVEDELAALGRFEQELASARTAVEELALTGDLAAGDASMLLLGLSALDARAVRARRSVLGEGVAGAEKRAVGSTRTDSD